MKCKNTNEELPQINDLINHFEKLYSKEGKINENDYDRIKNDKESNKQLITIIIYLII